MLKFHFQKDLKHHWPLCRELEHKTRLSHLFYCQYVSKFNIATLD
jgi:hypothetical protein